MTPRWRWTDLFYHREEPMRAIYESRSLTKKAVCITSRLYLGQLYRVLSARASDHLLIRSPFEWKLP